MEGAETGEWLKQASIKLWYGLVMVITVADERVK